MFVCDDINCKKTFQFPGSISQEKRPMQNFASDVLRIVLNAPCCPFCGSKEFHEIPPQEQPPKK